MSRQRSISKIRFRIAAAVVAIAVSMLSLPLLANIELPQALADEGWEEITFDGKVPNHYEVCGDGCVRVETDHSVSMIGREVEVDLQVNQTLSWEWRIERPVLMSDLSKKGGDDRAIAVYIAFEFDPASASLGEILLRPVVKAFRGADAPGRGISYVWGGDQDRGTMVASPYQEDSAVIVIKRTSADPIGEWMTEQVDFVADYRQAFGVDPIGITHVLISADSDDVASPNRAEVRALRFGGS